MSSTVVHFEDHVVGSVRTSTGRTVTEADVVLHAGQTGDFYPHHVDAVWCATQPFGARMAHGTLVLSVAVGLLAGDVNPVAMSYGYDRVRFVRPVFLGDTITARAEVSGVRDHRSRRDVGLVDESVTVTNQDGTVVLAFVHVYLVERAPAEGAASEGPASEGSGPEGPRPSSSSERP